MTINYLRLTAAAIFTAAVIGTLSCGSAGKLPVANFEKASSVYDLETGLALTPKQALKADAVYGIWQTDAVTDAQAISFVRFRPGPYKLEVLDAQAEKSDSTSALCIKAGAVAGINGSYFNVKNLTNTTYIKDDGIVTGNTKPSEVFRTNGAILFKDNKITIDAMDTTAVKAAGEKWQEGMGSGPVLVDEGVPAEYKAGIPGWKKFYNKRHPRSLVGKDAAGYIWFVVIDGRFAGKAEGMTVAELTALSLEMGFTDALNLDGGGSSTLWTKHAGVINHPYDNKKFDNAGQRIVPNVLAIRKTR